MTTGAVAKAIGLKREQAAEALLVQLEQEGKIKRLKPPDWDPDDEDVWVGYSHDPGSPLPEGPISRALTIDRCGR